MTRDTMWQCYNAIIKTLENHIIDTEHNPTMSNKTQFYFKDCCGGDIVSEALNYFK